MTNAPRRPTRSHSDLGPAVRGWIALLGAALALYGCSYSYGQLELAAVEPTKLRLHPQSQVVLGKDCTLYALGLLPLSRVVPDVGLAVSAAASEGDANGLADVTISRSITYAFLYSKECVEVRGRASQL